MRNEEVDDSDGKTKKRKRSDDSDFGNTSSTSVIVGKFEVFLSFRCIDTRMGFTDFLNKHLVDAGIRTYLDDNELRVGEDIGPELMKAIEESKICIPILSQNYASSRWCLHELAQMVKCKRSTKLNIKPIFYDVKPCDCDVNNRTGSYKEAFRQHEKDFDEETVKSWKEALKEVGGLKGWELQKDTNGLQAKLVEIVVEEVFLELKKNYMVVTDNLVGIDHHIEEMKRLLNVDSNNVRIVGIHGIGGIGKTTIAKNVYNELSGCFDCCCFLADVQEMSQQNSSLVNLQKQLISKIRKGKSPDIANVDEGIRMIESMACKKKVLIVLDDVDEESQFAKLVGKCNWFGSGSRIIVTTRNKGVLDELEVDEAYEPHSMERDHAVKLFSRHAFRSDSPLENFDILSKEIVSTTGGLPLALEIIGSIFSRERCKEAWEETLKKLRKIPNDQVQEKLRISYDALEVEEKQIFLDIACFFIGENKTLPIYMWDECEYYPISGIKKLVLRSLVKIGDDNEFRMHDQLRDLGREIVRKENTVDPGERSRLWICKEALDVLVGQMGTNKIEALCLQTYREIGWPFRSWKHSFTNDEFGKLRNLRFLRVDGACLTGDFKNLLSKLRWLQWRMCTDNSKPINFHLKNLVILDLSCSNITDNWEGWSQIKMAKNLKVLDLSDCNGLIETPDFSTFVSLERLILKNCSNFVEIGPSIGNLIKLRVLDISGSSGIRKLPDAIGGLEKLEEIYAEECYHIGIPSNIGRLPSLRILKLHSFRICSLLMSNICGLSCLQTLDLTIECDFLQSLPELPPSLRSLRLRNSIMETLPSLSNLMNLSDLMLVGCDKLMEIQGLECLESLSYLDILRCSSLKGLPDLSNLVMLKRLRLDSCCNLVEIRGFMGLKSLEILNMSYCRSLERLPDLSNMGMLKRLRLDSCFNLVEIRGLTGLKSLKILNMSYCESLERLPDLSNMGMLKILNLSHCVKLVEVGGLGGLKSLEILNMSWCNLFEGLLDLSNLKKLKKLSICSWENLTEVQGLEELKSLESLDISCCRLLEKSHDLSNLQKLKKLKACWCEKLLEIWGLEKLESLEILNISGCRLLEKSPDLSNLQKLEKLNVSWCENLPEIRGLEKLESLEILNISGCRLLEKSLDLSNLQKLRFLDVHGCENLPEIRGLKELEFLGFLDISGCKAIEKLPAIEELPNRPFRKMVIDRSLVVHWVGQDVKFDFLPDSDSDSDSDPDADGFY